VRAPAGTVTVIVDRSSGVPLPAQVAGQVRRQLTSGALTRGDRLPSSRALARELGVARAVVEQAYDQLHAEGWVRASRGAGTYVENVRASVAVEPRPPHPVAGQQAAGAVQPIRLDTGTPWRDPAHDAGWRRAWREVSATRPPTSYPDAAGLPELRLAVAAHLARHRGIACTPAQVLITSGTTHGLSLLLETLPQGTVALEDPGYRAAAVTVGERGWRRLDVPVDGDGIDVAALRRSRRADVRAVYVTPAHQHPLGMTLSPGRRRALLEESDRRGALVVEDDYDSEFRYDVAPLPALAQLGLDRVAYLGTTSKTVLPGLRIGWLVTTEERVAELAARRAARHDHPSWPVQRALFAMLRDGYVDRLLRSARRVYAQRWRLVTDRLAPYGRIDGGVAGMYAVLHLPPRATEQAIRAARAAGFDLPSLADYCRSVVLSGVVLGFGGLTDAQLEQALDAVQSALG
jgi:GntR family transcriptional regulator/MocR family aminotransferase